MKTPCLWYYRKGVIRKPVVLLLDDNDFNDFCSY